MDAWPVVVRVLFTYVVLLVLVRASGHRTVSQGTVFDFVLALVLGDLMDDMIWGEVPAAKFVVGAGTLALAHVALSLLEYSSWSGTSARPGLPPATSGP